MSAQLPPSRTRGQDTGEQRKIQGPSPAEAGQVSRGLRGARSSPGTRARLVEGPGLSPERPRGRCGCGRAEGSGHREGPGRRGPAAGNSLSGD